MVVGVLFGKRRHRWNITGYIDWTTLGSAVAAAQQAHGSCHICRVLVVVVRDRSTCSLWSIGARSTPLTVMCEAMVVCWCTFRKYRLVRTRIRTTRVAVAFRVSVCVIGLWRWSRLGRAEVVVSLRRSRRSWRRRVVAVNGRWALCVHVHQHRRSLEKLHLLMLRNQQFRRDLPLRCVFPSEPIKLALPTPWNDGIFRCTHRCLLRQLPCLYAFPQCSHFSSPDAAFSFFVRRVPSLALLALFFDLSTLWKDDSVGPSTTALLLPSGSEM